MKLRPRPSWKPRLNMSPRATVSGIQKLSSKRAILCLYMIPNPTATLGDLVRAWIVSAAFVPE